MKPWAAPLLLLGQCIAGSALAAEPVISRIVYVNYASPTKAPYINLGQGPLVNLVAQAETLRAQRALIAKNDFIKRRLPDFNLVTTIVEATRCFPMAGQAHRCLDPVVLDGSGEPLPEKPHGPGDVEQVISVSTDYNKLLAMRGGLIISLSFDETTYAAEGAPKRRHFALTYWQPPESKLGKGSPFDEALESSLSASEKAVQEYWMAGAPSRFEANVRRALEDFRTIADRYYPYAGDATLDATQTEWGRSLPLRGSLRAQGINACRGAECKRVYVEARDGRILAIPDQSPKGAIFQSAPLFLYKQP